MNEYRGMLAHRPKQSSEIGGGGWCPRSRVQRGLGGPLLRTPRRVLGHREAFSPLELLEETA